MLNYFSEKVVIVTGGASGLGEALCRALAKCDAKVVIVADINLKEAERVVTLIGDRAVASFLDVTDTSQMSAFIEKTKLTYGSLDFIFNNAGILISGELVDITPSEWQNIIAVNLSGVISGSLAA